MAYENPIPYLKNGNVHLIRETEQDYAQLPEVYFAFIDVLGFQKTFEDIKLLHKDEKAEKFRDVFNYYFELMNAANFMRNGKDSGCYAGQTSDTLYFYTDRKDYLLQFIRIFSHFTLYAMSKNVFFRGGIAKGSLYKKEKYQFYGDSVIGAYLLESKISKNPIITIDEKTHLDMSGIVGYIDLVDTESERCYIRPFLGLKEEIPLDTEDGFTPRVIDGKQVVLNIQKNKQDFEYDANNYSKYTFLLKELKKSNISTSQEVE